MGENNPNNINKDQDEREKIIQRNMELYLGNMAILGRIQGGHVSQNTGIETFNRFNIPAGDLVKSNVGKDIFEQASEIFGATVAPFGAALDMLVRTQLELDFKNLDPMTLADQERVLSVGKAALEAGYLGASKRDAMKRALTNSGQPYAPESSKGTGEAGTPHSERDISSVVDPVQEALGKAGYDPADPNMVGDAYVEGRASGLTHEEAVEYAAGVAKEAALAADVRALKEAASWTVPSEKKEEQKGNMTPQELEDWLSDVLDMVERTPVSGIQVASLGVPDFVADLMGANPAVAGFKQTQSRAQSTQTPSSQPAGPYDLAAEILGRSQPQTVTTPIGEVALGMPGWLTDYEIEKGLMSHPAYSNAKLPQSTPIRDTVKGFYASAYPGKVALDAAGRIDLGPRVSRPASAPGLFQGKASVARPAEPISTATITRTGLAGRQQAISAGVENLRGQWTAVQKETDARLAAEQAATIERDRKSLERAYGLEKQRDAAARASGEIKTSVSSPKSATLGSFGGSKDGLLGAQVDPLAAQAARNRAIADGTYVGAQELDALGGGVGADKLGEGRAGKQEYAARRPDNENWSGDNPYSQEAYDPSLGFFGNMSRDLSALGQAGTKAGSAQLAANRVAGLKAQNAPPDVIAAAEAKAKAAQEAADGEAARVICTELVAQGRMATDLYHLDLRFAEERLSAAHLRGYHLWAVPLVRWMRRSPRVSAIVAGPALWRAEEVAYLLGERERGSWRGKIVRLIGEPLCRLIGCWARDTDYRKLYERETNA